MAYPPTVPVNSRANGTATFDNHPADHNAISNALTDIINELGSGPKGGSADLTARLAAMIPPGTITMYGAAAAPSGYLLCDGSAVSMETYAALYAVVGVTYGDPGGGDFNLPNLKDRFPVGRALPPRTLCWVRLVVLRTQPWCRTPILWRVRFLVPRLWLTATRTARSLVRRTSTTIMPLSLRQPLLRSSTSTTLRGVRSLGSKRPPLCQAWLAPRQMLSATPTPWTFQRWAQPTSPWRLELRRSLLRGPHPQPCRMGR